MVRVDREVALCNSGGLTVVANKFVFFKADKDDVELTDILCT